MKNKPKLHLFRYLKPYRKDFIIAVMLIIFECALEISIPFLMKLMLDKGLTPRPFSMAVSCSSLPSSPSS